jgi:hypothetical protein
MNTSTFGQAVTLTATVAAASGAATPGGTVTLVIDGHNQAPLTLNGSGQVSLSLQTLSTGTHTINAVYSGDTSFAPSNAPAMTQQVNQARTTALAVAADATPKVFGQLATFYAAIQPVAPGAGVVTGTVQFVVDSVAQAPVQLNQFGMAGLYTNSLSAGTHTIGVVYGGDSNFIASTATPLTATIGRASTTTIVFPASAGPFTVGQAVTFFTAVQAVSPAVGTPTGQVQFIVDGTALAPMALNNIGMAGLSTSSLGVGPHTIVVSYGGDVDFVASSSATLNITINGTGRMT